VAIEFDLRDGFAGAVDPERASPAFANRLAAIADAGEGVLVVPPGRWVVDEEVRLTTRGSSLQGAGMRASVIEVQAGARTHGVVVEAGGVTIERLTVLGNRESLDDDDGFHGIRAGSDDADWLHIRDVCVEQAPAYGIGLQRASYEFVLIENVSIRECGRDGIDFKNVHDVGSRCFLKNVTVERHGLREANTAGIDIRGNVRMQNIEVIAVGEGRSGVRFRSGERGSQNGLGGDWSGLVNYFVTTAGRGARGVDNGDLTGVRVGNGNVVAMRPIARAQS